ncbi:hypothetical protein [Oceanobacillus oncorhynchi]
MIVNEIEKSLKEVICGILATLSQRLVKIRKSSFEEISKNKNDGR